MILDGYGLRIDDVGNAVKLANTPFLKELFKEPLQGKLIASGEDVGLPAGLMGNSEVGHLNLGAGRVVYQELTRIDKSIEKGEFFEIKALKNSMRHAVDNGKALHLLGLVSDGCVHSSMDHIYALLEMAQREGVKQVFLHAFMDGRDTPPHAGGGYLKAVEAKMREFGVGKIATVIGRYWAMDRDKRWDRVERAYKALTAGEGMPFGSAEEAVTDSYKRDVTDEFIEPSVIVGNGKPVGTISEGDAVIFFNFRADRAREMTMALTQPGFDGFVVKHMNLHYTTMTLYRDDFGLPAAYLPQSMDNIMGQVIANAGLKQFRIAETEKYAHVTFFFNGGVEIANPGEERLLVNSPKVATYDLQPQMSAPEVAKEVLTALDKDYSFILLNFANPDMVGHTGKLEAAEAALEALDPLVQSILAKAQQQGYATFVTADHGNCEQMFGEGGEAHTAHTKNLVPVALVMPDGSRPELREGGRLADVSPTLLSIIGIEQPGEMTGKSLLMPA
ncbi:2,3-bisphosphoglycerate-independent phosphoglycerate mutase [Calditrichota bacterium]